MTLRNSRVHVSHGGPTPEGHRSTTSNSVISSMNGSTYPPAYPDFRRMARNAGRHSLASVDTRENSPTLQKQSAFGSRPTGYASSQSVDGPIQSGGWNLSALNDRLGACTGATLFSLSPVSPRTIRSSRVRSPRRMPAPCTSTPLLEELSGSYDAEAARFERDTSYHLFTPLDPRRARPNYLVTNVTSFVRRRRRPHAADGSR